MTIMLGYTLRMNYDNYIMLHNYVIRVNYAFDVLATICFLMEVTHMPSLFAMHIFAPEVPFSQTT